MSTIEPLILDLLQWLGSSGRAYAEVIDAWRTSCPRLPVWEEANERDEPRGCLSRSFPCRFSSLEGLLADSEALVWFGYPHNFPQCGKGRQNATDAHRLDRICGCNIWISDGIQGSVRQHGDASNCRCGGRRAICGIPHSCTVIPPATNELLANR